MADSPIKEHKEVAQYLVKTYKVSEPRAEELVKKYKDEIDKAQQMGSFIWFVGDQIADSEELEPMEEEDFYDLDDDD